jgi:hypothetical protein
VYLLPVAAQGALITDVVPEIFYNAEHPVATLTEGSHAGFTVRTRVYLWSPAGLQGKLKVMGDWGAAASTQLEAEAGSFAAGGGVANLLVPAGTISIEIVIEYSNHELHLQQYDCQSHALLDGAGDEPDGHGSAGQALVASRKRSAPSVQLDGSA